MASLTQWTWVWASFGSWWWTGKPDVLQSMGSQSRTQLSDRTELNFLKLKSKIWILVLTHCQLIHTSDMNLKFALNNFFGFFCKKSSCILTSYSEDLYLKIVQYAKSVCPIFLFPTSIIIVFFPSIFLVYVSVHMWYVCTLNKIR